MQIYYKTKKTAQAAFRRKEKKFMELICPVFKKECMSKKCVSFSGRVYHIQMHGKPINYRVSDPCCNSPLVTGVIEMEMP
jgi:hypothetical protein